MHEPAGDRAHLRQLLRTYNERPERRQEVLAEIERSFSRALAILVIDCSGFTRATRLRGIIPFLALLERLERLVTPIVRGHRGRLLRAEADNFFAVFPDAPSAVSCAEQVQHDVTAANELLPETDEVYLAIGIGYGPVLLVGADDLYGDEMNLACKLGEDLAQRGEVLLTPAARAALGASERAFEELHLSISGLELTAHRLLLPQERAADRRP